jgi:hypothetical protein
MKTTQQIKDEIAILEEKHRSEKGLYKAMHQMDIQSGEGNQCRKYIAMTEGKITALKWVLK